MNDAWICPRCGKVNAPWMAQCTCDICDAPKVVYGTGEDKKNKRSMTNEYGQTQLSADEQMICS